MNNTSFIYKKLPLSTEYLLAVLRNNRMGFLLESSLHAHNLGRFSFFGIDPFMILESKDGHTSIMRDGEQKNVAINALQQLRTLLNRYSLNTEHTKIDIPFLGGAVGFFSYDLGFRLEKIQRTNGDDVHIPDMWFAFFDLVVCIDHYKDRVLIFSSGFPETNPRLRGIRADVRLKQFLAHLGKAEDKYQWHRRCTLLYKNYPLQSNFTTSDYLNAVRRALTYIKNGDIYQINLSQRFQTKTDLTAEQLYTNLKNIFPVPFGGIVRSDDFSVISGSPERFIKYDGRFLFTRPMKGTRPRSSDQMRDKALRKELERSDKDKAELLMIVDLERNDLGRVCDYGSVRVQALRCLEEYSTVFQTTAQITGRLYDGRDRIDVIKACFPGGSITGCPKIRAMQIIEELEPNRRGIYTGCLGYFSFNGQMDFNILIRSFFKRKRDVYFGVGGGIVYDSQPRAEYDETLVKAKALKRALLSVDIERGKYNRVPSVQILTSTARFN